MRLSRVAAQKMGITLDRIAKKTASKLAKTDKYQGRDQVFDQLCTAHGLPIPVHEYAFHPERKFRADFCFDGWLILEVQGGIYGRGKPCPTCGRRAVGAHSSIKDMKRDIERQREAVRLGYALIHCLPEEIEDGSIFPILKVILANEMEQP